MITLYWNGPNASPGAMMKPALIAALLVLFLAAALIPASPGEPVPLWPKHLLDEAKKATPHVAKILSELAVPDEAGTEPTYENRVPDRLQMLPKAEGPQEGALAADQALPGARRS